MFNQEIFKAYDIRGIYGKDFDDDFAYQLGLAYCAMRREELAGNDQVRIVVGRDMRVSSPRLHERLIEGICDGGFDVVDIGMVSTPTFYFAVAQYGYDGGILISASHNPAHYNGFKIVRQHAVPVSGNTGIEQLRDTMMGGALAKSEHRGMVKQQFDVVQNQVAHDRTYADLEAIKPFTVVVDTTNGMGADYLDLLFALLPCRMIRMNWEFDGTFPNHEADPLKPENIRDLCKRVVSEHADLGIATDGDGDRIFFVDETGKQVQPGIVRAILSKIFLRENPGAKIVYDIRPGRITEDTIRENGGVPVVSRVGHSFIKEKVLEQRAVFAGESSGHFYLNMPEGCYEVPMIVTLKLLQELSVSGVKFSEYIKPYERYFNSGEINFVVLEKAAKITEIKKKYHDGRQSDLDGVSVEYDDWWFNARPSNTEPLLRLIVEARTKNLLDEKVRELTNFLSFRGIQT